MLRRGGGLQRVGGLKIIHRSALSLSIFPLVKSVLKGLDFFSKAVISGVVPNVAKGASYARLIVVKTTAASRAIAISTIPSRAISLIIIVSVLLWV